MCEKMRAVRAVRKSPSMDAITNSISRGQSARQGLIPLNPPPEFQTHSTHAEHADVAEHAGGCSARRVFSPRLAKGRGSCVCIACSCYLVYYMLLFIPFHTGISMTLPIHLLTYLSRYLAPSRIIT